MAGMFYSLQEVAEKLSRTEEQIKELVKQGRLREFRDGSNLLFKIDEVEALLSDTGIMASQGSSALAEAYEIALAPEPTETPPAAELTGADTAIAAEGVDVLGDTDGDYKLADDTMDETKAASSEVSLEEIEEDVNLDTFGSGSGLLDLSLQADDTSLGGILDEIYTPEGEDQQAPEALEPEVAPDAEQMLSAVGIEAPESEPEIIPTAQAYVEPQPDVLSNAFGIMLFLPLLAVIYTVIVTTVAGFGGTAPAIATKVQGIIWYIVLAAILAAALIVGAAFVLGGPAGKKQKTKKRPRAEKVKKSASQPQDETA